MSKNLVTSQQKNSLPIAGNKLHSKETNFLVINRIKLDKSCLHGLFVQMHGYYVRTDNVNGMPAKKLFKTPYIMHTKNVAVCLAFIN